MNDTKSTKSTKYTRSENSKKTRYKNQYYKCFGIGCNHDWRYLPNLFIKKPIPQPIKEIWKDLNLEPKFYYNNCMVCSFLKDNELDRTRVKELISHYKRNKSTDKFLKYETDFLKKNYTKYQQLIENENNEIAKLIQSTRKIDNENEIVKLETQIHKIKEYYDLEIEKLKKRITKLEKNEPITITKSNKSK